MNAPITIAPKMTGKKNNQIKVAIKVKNFKNIQAITLRLDYLSSVLKFVRATPAKNMPGTPIAHESVVDEQYNKLKFVWSDLTPFSLKNNQVLFYAYFKINKNGGTTSLRWNTEAQGGHDCDYAIVDKIPVVLVDDPRDDFYIDGEITA